MTNFPTCHLKLLIFKEIFEKELRPEFKQSDNNQSDNKHIANKIQITPRGS